MGEGADRGDSSWSKLMDCSVVYPGHTVKPRSGRKQQRIVKRSAGPKEHRIEALRQAAVIQLEQTTARPRQSFP